MAGRRTPGYHPAWHNAPGKEPSLKNRGFYHTPAWRKLRVVALQRDHYLCQACLKKHRFTKATEVHHIKPLEDFPELGLDLDNLMSLCWQCHEETKDHGRHVSTVPSGVRVIKIASDDGLNPEPDGTGVAESIPPYPLRGKGASM